MSDLRSICESKGFDEKSYALPEVQETNTVETKVEDGMLYISERVHKGSYYHWWVPKGPVDEYYGFGGYNYWGFDSDGCHWDEQSQLFGCAAYHTGYLGGYMAAKGLASLRKEFGALLKKHDGADFRFIVEMLYHSEPLVEGDFDPIVWSAGNRAVDILYDVNAEYDKVYEWGQRGPNNSRAMHKLFFLKHGQL